MGQVHRTNLAVQLKYVLVHVDLDADEELIARLVGIEHVGIGTDSDLTGYDALPPEVYEKLKGHYKTSYSFRDKIDIEGLDHPKKIYDVTEALLRRGYGNEDIRAVLGGNFRRELRQIWTS